MTSQDLRKLLDERDASRESRRRAWENLEEIGWVLNRKIVFAGLRSKGKTLAGTDKLMLRTYKDWGVADISVEQWFGNGTGG